LVQHADLHVGVLLDEPPRLAILLRHELLVERRDLDVEVVRRQIEVGRERLDRPSVAVVFEGERTRLVLPDDAVEVEQLRELPFGVVRETNQLVRKLFVFDGALPCSYRAAACGDPPVSNAS
jgi:hypothetical protein